jgi:hypothetical protein
MIDGADAHFRCVAIRRQRITKGVMTVVLFKKFSALLKSHKPIIVRKRPWAQEILKGRCKRWRRWGRRRGGQAER